MKKIVSVNNQGIMTVNGEIVEYPLELEGGRNLLLDTGIPKSSAEYLMTSYKFKPESLVVGETYTLTMKFKLGANRTGISIDSSDGYWEILNTTPETEGTFKSTFVMDADPTYAVNYLNFYQIPRTADSVSTIEWVKIEKGSESTPWTPAPEDLGLYYPSEVQHFGMKFLISGVSRKYTDFYGDTKLIVTNPTDPIYNKFPNPPVGAVFNSYSTNLSEITKGFIDIPAVANTVIALLNLYEKTNDSRYLDKAKMISEYIKSTGVTFSFYGSPTYVIPNRQEYKDSAWKTATGEINTRTQLQAIWVMSEMYKATNDISYKDEATKILKTVGAMRNNVNLRVTDGELEPFMKGAIYDLMVASSSAGTITYSWSQFSISNADVLAYGLESYISNIGDVIITDTEGTDFKPSDILADFSSHIKSMYSAGILTMSPTGLPYSFVKNGIPSNWDWVETEGWGDTWFTNDSVLWIINGISKLSSRDPDLKPIAEEYRNRFVALRIVNHPTYDNAMSEVLFYDRYDFNGNHIPDDTSISISGTAILLVIDKNLGIVDDALHKAALNTLKKHMYDSENRNISGAFGWDAANPESTIEVKATGEIYHSEFIDYAIRQLGSVVDISDRGGVLTGGIVEYPPELAGGRNLFKKSNEFIYNAYMGAQVSTENNISVPEWGAKDATHIKTSGGSSTIKYYKSILPAANTIGELYTISIWVKNVGTSSLVVANNKGHSIKVLQGESRLVILTMPTLGFPTQNLQIHFQTEIIGDSLDFIVWRAKAEKGIKATQWTPAPEDLGLTYPDWVQSFGGYHGDLLPHQAYADIDGKLAGGRNLLPKSTGKFTLTPRDTGATGDNFNYYRFYYGIEINRNYSFTADVTPTGKEFTTLTVYRGYPGGSAQTIPIINGKINFTFSTSSAQADSILVYAGIAGATRGQGIIIENVKIEKGTKATPWTPAPEDLGLSYPPAITEFVKGFAPISMNPNGILARGFIEVEPEII